MKLQDIQKEGEGEFTVGPRKDWMVSPIQFTVGPRKDLVCL